MKFCLDVFRNIFQMNISHFFTWILFSIVPNKLSVIVTCSAMVFLIKGKLSTRKRILLSTTTNVLYRICLSNQS